MEKTMSVDMGMQDLADDETFTMVIPSVKLNQPDEASSQQSPSQLPRSPRNRSPHKAAENGGSEEEVKVYEDPFDGQNSEQPASERKPVLEEVPVNEAHNATDAPSLSSGNDKSSGSTMDGNEVVRSRRLLASGTERIRRKELDAHGFRRLQDIVKNKNDAIWAHGDPLTDTPDAPPPPTEKRFNMLLSALLDYVEAPIEALKIPGVASSNGAGAPSSSFKAQNLKTQALSTTRAMLFLHKKDSAPFLPRAICSVARARAQYESNAHIAAELERTIEDAAQASSDKNGCVDAVLNLLEAERLQASEGDQHARTIAAALNALTQLLKSTGDGASGIGAPQTERLGKVAVRFLDDAVPDVRKADMEMCLEMHDKLGGERGGAFWKAVEGASEGHLNLIAYYVARRTRS
jgi:CLIP-associating protein 1/2